MTLPTFSELAFEQEKHIYKLNGVKIPCVTDIMQPVSYSYYMGIEDDVMEKAAFRGTAIHNAIENLVRYDIEDIPSEFSGYLDAFKNWHKDYSPEFIATESRVYHKYLMYAGTIDTACVINKKIVCVDYKSTSAINTILTKVQLEAYARAYESQGFVFDSKAILHLKSDGRYSFIEYEKSDTDSWEVFGALMVVYNHLKK